MGSGVVIEEGAEVRDSILLPHTRIGRGSRIVRTIVNEGVRIAEDSEIGNAGGGDQRDRRKQQVRRYVKRKR